jgi:hypothetical protein
MILNILTFIHLVFSLIAIGTGLKVLSGLLTMKPIDKWAVTFLRCILVASVSGLLLPLHPLLPTHWIAMISVYVSGAAILGWCKFHLAGVWRAISVLSITIVFCLNILLVTAQAFRHIPALKPLASIQSGPAFLISEFAVMAIFTVLGMVAVLRSRDKPAHLF